METLNEMQGNKSLADFYGDINEVDAPAPSASAPPEFITRESYTQPEPGEGMASFEEMQAIIAARGQELYAERQRNKRLEGLRAVALMDVGGEEAKALMRRENYIHHLRKPQTEDELSMFGKDYLEALGVDAEPMQLAQRVIEAMPDANKRALYQQRMEQARRNGRDSSRTYYALIGEIARDEWQEEHRQYQQKLAEQQAARDADRKLLDETLDRIAFDDVKLTELDPRAFELIQKSGISMQSIRRLRKAYRLLDPDLIAGMEGGSFLNGDLERRHRAVWAALEGDETAQALLMDAVARKAGEAAKNGDAGFLGSYMEHVNKWAAQGVDSLKNAGAGSAALFGESALRWHLKGRARDSLYLETASSPAEVREAVRSAGLRLLRETPEVLQEEKNPYAPFTGEGVAWELMSRPYRQQRDSQRFNAFMESMYSSIAEGRHAGGNWWTRTMSELGTTTAFLNEFMLPGKATKVFNIGAVITSATGRVGAQAESHGGDAGSFKVGTRGSQYGALEAGAFMLAPKMLWGSAAALAGKVPLLRAGMQKVAGSTAGTYAVSAARTTADFAAVIPMSTAGAKILYDQVAADPQLASGMQEWTALMQEMQRPEYWGMMALNGLVFGAQAPMMRAAARHDARTALNRAERQELALAGLTKEEIKSVMALEPGKRTKEARRLVDNHLENDAAGMISRGLAEARKVVNRQRAQQMRKDAAVQFALEQHGMRFEPCEEEGKVFLCIEEKSKDGAEPKVRRLKLDEIDADAVVEQVMHDRLSAHAKVYRSLLGEHALIEEFRGLKGKVEIKLLPEAPTVEKAQKSAELAENRAEARKRELMEEGKAEAEAREMALDEVHKDVDAEATLREVIRTAEDLSKRIELEKARGGSETAGTAAFVVSTRDASGNISERVLNLAINDPRMKASRVAEELGEQTAKDWIEDGNMDGYTEAYRMLHELQELMGKHENPEAREAARSFLSLGKGNKELSERVRKGATDADLTPAELADVRREVVEAVSKLMHADLLHEASNLQAEFPAWARGLFDKTSLSLAEVQRVMALANALATARKEGWLPEAAQKLLGVAPKVVKDALARKGEPTLEDYREAYMAESRRQAELDALYGGQLRDPAEAERFEAECREGQERVEAERREEEAAAAEVSREMVRELEEENPGMSHKEAVRETAERYADAKEEEIAAAPAAQEDAAFSGGRCIEVTEERGLSIKAGMVKVEGLEVMPNFKQGADSTSGVVHPLRGDYRPDHDPVRVWRRSDGRLVVISGRHRLDACRRAGATRIMAYVYEESPARNEAWARRFDVECNIRDNQATPLEVALYARGEYTEGRVPTDAEMAAAGLDRKGTLGAMGLRIGRNASDAVIDSLRNERIDDRTALWISDFCPGNEGVQRAGLQRALEGASKGEILARMEAELALRGMRGEDSVQQFDLFGNVLENDGFMDFVGQYVNRRRNELAKDITYLKNVAGKRVSREMAEKYGVDVGDAEGLKKKLAEMQGLQERWKNPYTDTELMGEVRDAWKGETLEGWAKSEASEPAEKTQDEVRDSGTMEFDFSTVEPVEGEVTTELGRITEGEMGRYGTLIDRRMAMQGEKSHDAQVERMRAAIARRVQQMESLGDRDKFDGLKMHAEAMAVLTEFESLLPKSYGYGLEPYKLYLNFYAQLREHSDPAFASRIIPMNGWDKRMAGAMEKFAQRLVDGRLRREELSFLTEADLAIVEEWQKAFNAEYQLQKEGMALELADMTPKQKKAALAGLAEEVAAKIAPVEERMEIVSRVRADRLISKFLERVALQLDHFRKDRTLGRIRREIDRLRPADGKDGKPVKGRMDAERYQKVQDLLKLLELTRSERDAFVETRYTEGNTRGERAWAEMGENELITVEVFDYEGNPETITCTKQEFETYACFDSMSAAQAEAASRALGEYIQTGRQAWENAQAAEKARIEAMAASMMDGFASKSINDIKQLKEDIRKNIATGSRLRALLGWTMNSAQFFDSLTGNPAAAKWATETVDRIGRANVYLENTEKNRGIFLAKAVARAAGVADVKDARKFLDDITAIQDSGIEFKAQMPDFLGRESVALCQRFLKLLGRKARQKNFRANTFAEALRYLASARDEAGRRLVPEALAKEALAKYGKLGDASKSRLKGVEAVKSVLTAQEFTRYANLTEQAETRAEAAKVKWSETEAAARMENREAGEAGQTRRMSRAEAAYHVLLAEQADYTEMMRRQGYTPEVLDKLRAFAGEDVMGLARELRTEMGARTEAVKEVYEKLYGMPFPQVDNYFRAFFDAGYETRAHTALDGTGYAGAAGAGSIKILYTRQHHNRRVESTVNILNAFLDGMKQQDILLGYGSLATDLQRLMRYSRDADHTFENAFVDAFGLDAWNHMKQHVENMTRMATDVEQCTVGLSKLMNRLSSSSAITVLPYRVGTWLKQKTALLNSISGSDMVGMREWWGAASRVAFGRGEISFKELASRPELGSRFKGWSYGADMEAMRGIHDVKVGHGATSKHTLTGMELLSYEDFRANVRSSQILYTAVIRKLKKTRPEMTAEQRDSFAMNEVRRALGFRSQPLDWRGRSILSTRGSVFKTGMLFLAGESMNSAGNMVRLATRRKKGDFGRLAHHWLVAGASMQAMTALYNWMTDDEDMWEKRSPWSYVFGAALGPLNGVPFVMQGMGGIAAVANGFLPRGSRLWLPSGSLIPGADLTRPTNNLRKLWEKGGSWQDWTIAVNDALRALSGVMAASTVNSNSPLGASTRGASLVFAGASNLFDFIMRTWRAADERM